MAIEVIGGKLLIDKYEKFVKSIITEKVPFQLASDLRNMIVQRSKKGVGLKGGFKPYSTHPYYRSKRGIRPVAKGGRPSKTGKTVYYEGGYRAFAAATKGTTTPNLFASGAMFKSMQARPLTKYQAQIIFTNDIQARKAIQNNETREFFGATEQEKKVLTNSFNLLIKNNLKDVKLN